MALSFAYLLTASAHAVYPHACKILSQVMRDGPVTLVLLAGEWTPKLASIGACLHLMIDSIGFLLALTLLLTVTGVKRWQGVFHNSNISGFPLSRANPARRAEKLTSGHLTAFAVSAFTWQARSSLLAIRYLRVSLALHPVLANSAKAVLAYANSYSWQWANRRNGVQANQAPVGKANDGCGRQANGEDGGQANAYSDQEANTKPATAFLIWRGRSRSSFRVFGGVDRKVGKVVRLVASMKRLALKGGLWTL